MSNDPKEDTSQTPGKGAETEQKEETYTKSQLTEIISKEIAKVTAKHSKKMDELRLELDTEKKKSLPDPEKVKLEIEERDRKLAEREARIASLEANEKKRSALDLAKLNLPPDVTLSDLLNMMPGNEDDQIVGYIETFKKMFPESRSLGSSTTQGDKTKQISLVDQVRKLENEMLKLETPPLEKQRMAKEVIRLKGLISKGDKVNG